MRRILIIIFILTTYTSVAQEKKDTLFFYYDSDYIVEYETEGKFSIKDTQEGDGESFIFWKRKTLCDLEPEKILNLKSYIRNSGYYQEEKIIKLNDLRLAEHFNKFRVFLLSEKKGRRRYIEVSSGTEQY